jgi:hypothetical protein
MRRMKAARALTVVREDKGIMPVVLSMLLMMVGAIFLNADLARASSNCQAHYEVLGKEKADAVLGAISRAMFGASETITGNGYSVSLSPKGRCSIDIRMEDAGKSLVCSETMTLCLDDLPQEEVDRIRQRNDREELKRQELLVQLGEEGKARVEAGNREKERAREEHKKQLLEGVPREYLENPERYLPIVCNEYHVELKNVRSCQIDTECGQILAGTSCGCTRDLVARKNADLAKFKDLKKTSLSLLSISSTVPDACSDVAAMSTCDCPEANGFLCVDSVCKWNYTPVTTIPGTPESVTQPREH